MLLLILCCQLEHLQGLQDLNTSNVTVNLGATGSLIDNDGYLNTSNVTVNLCLIKVGGLQRDYLNTSNVTVNLM